MRERQRGEREHEAMDLDPVGDDIGFIRLRRAGELAGAVRLRRAVPDRGQLRGGHPGLHRRH